MRHAVLAQFAILVFSARLLSAGEAPDAKPTTPAAPAPKVQIPEIYQEYKDYKPSFLNFIPKDNNEWGKMGWPTGWVKDETERKLSSEPSFFTLSSGSGLCMDDEMDGYIKVAKEYESAGNSRKALETYLELFEKRLNRSPNDMLYRVSEYGVFVPMRQYCLRRILNMPAVELDYYRKLTDASAQESFEQARRQNSLAGLAEVADTMLATSYGDKALLELGNAAMDDRNFLQASEYYSSLLTFFKDSKCRTPELDLKFAYCKKMIGEAPVSINPKEKSGLSQADLDRLKALVSGATKEPESSSQLASAPNVACDDFTRFMPLEDPIAIKNPVWKFALPGSRKDNFVYSQPVITENSLIYRNKNIIYCHSLVNGQLRWVNDMGGMVRAQNWREMMHPEEDVLVKDGMVFTPMQKVGPSLVALDEISGQLRWAHGPLAASTHEESLMRFEAAPAAGEGTIFAGYVLDNIEGSTHINSEYGITAYESSTGRQQWRTPLCNLSPGKPTFGFTETRRNHIRSFTSPPIYHQGTVYYCTNAGVVSALDARSGRVKWYMRYPFHPEIHDAHKPFAGGPAAALHGGVLQVAPDPVYWLNQRPLIIGDKLYITPVDSPLLLCIDRRTGKVIWSKPWGSNGYKYFLGAISTGELLIVGNGRNKEVSGWGRSLPGAVWLVNPETGEPVWNSPDLIMNDPQPVMNSALGVNNRYYENGARPFLDSNDNLCITNWTDISPYYRPGCNIYHLTCLNLKDKKITHQRRYYTGEVLAQADITIHGKHVSWYSFTSAPDMIEELNKLPVKDDKVKAQIKQSEEVAADTTPVNEYGPFQPFSRMTFSRFGTLFELRFGPREISMVYDRDAVKKAVEQRQEPQGLFVKAELALGEARLDDAASLLSQSLAATSSEDLDFRALVNQQQFYVHQRLAQRGIFRSKPDEELDNCLGLSRTAATLAEEIETLFALADAYERKGNPDAAARCLRNVIAVYGQREYPITPIYGIDHKAADELATQVLDRTKGIVNPDYYGPEMTHGLMALKKSTQLYFSTLSPLPKTLTIRAGELAATRLTALQQRSAEVAKTFEAMAEKDLAGGSADDQTKRIWEFPASPAAQRCLDKLFQTIDGAKGELTCSKLFALADAARVAGLKVPDAFTARVLAVPENENLKSMALPYGKNTVLDLSAELEPERLLLPRRDGGSNHANLMFVGARIKKKSGYKYTLSCHDLNSQGKQIWRTEELRLGIKLQQASASATEEGGFFEAFVHKDMVIVHGLYNVLAFGLEKGEPRWTYAVPFDFEIRNAVQSGNVLVLAGQSETVAINLETVNGLGEVIWQEKEAGDPYVAPYFVGDRVISVRKLPFNVTERFRGTGKLIGRLTLPDLTLNDENPLIDDGPRELPVAHDEKLLFVTDQNYYIAVDTERMTVLWKRLIDTNDPTHEPKLRFFAKGKYFGVLKEDFTDKAFHMMNAETGELLWTTNPKDGNAPLPTYSVVMDGKNLYGLALHPGQGFLLVGYECATGKKLFNPAKEEGYQGKPKVFLYPHVFDKHLVAQIEDGRNFEMRVYEAATGKMLHKLVTKGDGPLGIHGRVSGLVQDGKLGFLTKDEFTFCLP